MARPKLFSRAMLNRLKQRVKDKLRPKKPTPPHPAPTSPCHFFKLPVELRITIYEYAMCDFRPALTKQNDYTNTRAKSAPLIQTCRLIRREAIGYYCNRIRAYVSELSHELDLRIELSRRCLNLFRNASNYGDWITALEMIVEMYNESLNIAGLTTDVCKANVGAMHKAIDLGRAGYWTGYLTREQKKMLGWL